jgi:hypothetical protein
MYGISDENGAIRTVIQRKMTIAVARHLENLEQAPVVNSDLFTAAKCKINPLGPAHHFSDPGARFVI